MSRTISLCMIVKNEEKVLARCLDSVKDKVDEIIIVDTGSTDLTLDIARKYTHNIFYFEWIDDFSAARNESLKHASSEYILVLDADEYLAVEADLQADLATDSDFYLLHIINEVSLGRSFSHSAVRLFKNDGRMHYENRLHEHLNITENPHLFKGTDGQTVIYHSGYTDETMIEKDKMNRNLPLMQREVEEHPTAYNLFNMGKTYLGVDQHDKAIVYFKKAYPISRDKVFLPELLTKFAFSLGELNRPEEGLAILKDAVFLFPQETEMRFVQGKLYAKAGYVRDAIECFQKCLELGDQGTTVTEGSGGYMALFQLAELYENEGRIKESYEKIVKVLEMKRSFVPGLKKYFDITLKLNMSNEDVQQEVEHLYPLKSIENLQFLFNILYGLRHPLLERYLIKYKINVQDYIMACGKLYSKQFEESRRLWNLIKEKVEENGPDILLLAILLKDSDLLLSGKPLHNLNHKEYEWLRSYVSGQESKPHRFSTTLTDRLLEVARQSIILREFDVFEFLAEILMKQSANATIKLGSLLGEYGFDEVAIDILIKLFEQQPNNATVIRMLGDLCYRNHYLEDAQLFYSKLLNLDPQYSSYERSYDLYENLREFENAKKIRREISQAFPLANWARENFDGFEG